MLGTSPPPRAQELRSYSPIATRQEGALTQEQQTETVSEAMQSLENMARAHSTEAPEPAPEPAGPPEPPARPARPERPETRARRARAQSVELAPDPPAMAEIMESDPLNLPT
jgi:hypothetical protein